MRIYLAGPMRGLPGLNFGSFHMYATRLRAEGHEVFSPAEVKLPQDNIREIFAVEMEWLCRKAEAVYLLPGWEKSKGANAERALAVALDLLVFQAPHPTANSSLSVLPASTISHSHLPKWLKSHLRDRSNTAPRGGIDQNQATRATPLFVIFLSVAAWIAGMGSAILLNLLGGH